MSIDVTYQGLALAKDAKVRFEGSAIFIETDGPMPVATRLTLSHGDDSLVGRVRRVKEGQGAGMLVVPADAASEKLPRWLMPLHAESAKEEFFVPLPPPPPPVVTASVAEAAPASNGHAAEASSEAASESGRTPPPDAEGAAGSEEDDDGKASAANKKGGAAKKPKKPRRR